MLGADAVSAVGISGLVTKREVDTQVWWTLDGLQCSMDGLEGSHTDRIGQCGFKRPPCKTFLDHLGGSLRYTS